jgi:uncharacterized surface protein with fasciclin (FAS1) repeats
MITNGGSVQTLEGKNITTKITDGKVYINQAQVITADVEAANGVVHIIDEVLSESSASITKVAAFAWVMALGLALLSAN